MTRIQYTGNNYAELKQFIGDRLLAPYDCMGPSRSSFLTAFLSECLIYRRSRRVLELFS